MRAHTKVEELTFSWILVSSFTVKGGDANYVDTDSGK